MFLWTNFGQKPFCTCIHQSDVSYMDYIHWTSLWLVNKAILVSLYNHTTKLSIHLHSVWSKQPWPNKCTSCSIYAKPKWAQYHLSNHRHVPQHIHGSTTRNRSITLLTSHINIHHSITAQTIHEDTKNMMKEWERARETINRTKAFWRDTEGEKDKCSGKPNRNMNYFDTDQSNFSLMPISLVMLASSLRRFWRRQHAGLHHNTQWDKTHPKHRQRIAGGGPLCPPQFSGNEQH